MIQKALKDDRANELIESHGNSVGYAIDEPESLIDESNIASGSGFGDMIEEGTCFENLTVNELIGVIEKSEMERVDSLFMTVRFRKICGNAIIWTQDKNNHPEERMETAIRRAMAKYNDCRRRRHKCPATPERYGADLCISAIFTKLYSSFYVMYAESTILVREILTPSIIDFYALIFHSSSYKVIQKVFTKLYYADCKQGRIGNDRANQLIKSHGKLAVAKNEFIELSFELLRMIIEEFNQPSNNMYTASACESLVTVLARLRTSDQRRSFLAIPDFHRPNKDRSNV